MSDRPSDHVLDDYAAKAAEALAALRGEHARFDNADLAPATTYTYKGNFVFAAAFVWMKVSTNNPITFSDGTVKSFSGTCWGLGLGGGTSWGGGSFSVPPSTLGDCNIQVAIASIAVQISFWNGGTPIGIFAGGGLGVGGAAGGGSGKWS